LWAGCGDPQASSDADAIPDTSADSSDDSASPDTGPAPASCNFILNEGCGDGEKCSFPTSGASKAECMPAGTKAVGDECSGVGECVEGVCISLNDTDQLCYAFCKTIAHCNMDACLELQDSPYKVCDLDVEYETCDLLQQSCTKPGQACYVTTDGAVCLPAGTADIDEDCDGVSDCAPGGVCINSRCKAVCDKNDDNPCGDFKPCANYYGGAGYCDD
jgi:hypothetical protein